MSMTESADWGVVAPVYNHVERLTLPAAQTLVKRVSAILPLDSPNTTAFDNGCGTGVLSTVLKQQYPRITLLATDASDGMIDIFRKRIDDQKWVNVTTRVVDSRNLDGVKDGSFTHTLSTFMVCLAPEPEKIVSEMWRVTKEGGVLGLAVWGDPYFGPFTMPWVKACRRQIPDYESATIMDANWTLARNVFAGIEKVGFDDVDVWEEDCSWRWESVEAVSKYFLDGGNPGNLKSIDSFKARGGKVDEVKPHFESMLQDEYGQKDGSIELHVLATFATARK